MYAHVCCANCSALTSLTPYVYSVGATYLKTNRHRRAATTISRGLPASPSPPPCLHTHTHRLLPAKEKGPD